MTQPPIDAETTADGHAPAAPPPGPKKRASGLWRVLLGLAVAGVGGAAFAFVGTPLPFMLGAMALSAFAAIMGVPVKSPAAIRPVMAAIIGAMLGTSFTADVIADAPRWILPLLGLILFMLACALASVNYLRKVAGFDGKTAFFAGMPGGLAEMVMIGEASGGDVRKIAMIHATRIMLIVFTIPFVIRYVADADMPAIQPGAISIFEADWTFYLWFAGTCLVGVGLAHLVRLPAKYMLGPMIASAFVHVMGWTDYKLPYELVIVAQIVLGATIGCRFVGLTFRDTGMMAVAGVGSTVILIAITAVFAFTLSSLLDIGPISIILAYSPGGFVEMGLVALAVGIDTAFVAVHHLIRLMLVGLSAPVAFRLLGLSGPRAEVVDERGGPPSR